MFAVDVKNADEWEDVVSDCFVPLNCISFDTDFRGRMEYLRLGSNISISALKSDGLTVKRSQRQATRANNDDLHLLFQRTSHGFISQGSRTVAVGPRMVTTYATNRPYFQDWSAPGQSQFIVQIARSMVDLPSAMIDAACDRIAITSTESTQVLLAYLAHLNHTASADDDGFSDSDEPTAITSDLAAVMIQSSFAGHRVIPRTRGGLLYSVEDFIGRNALRVTLEDVASEFFISRRTLYNLFDRLGTSPGEYLRQSKLRRAAAMLVDPELRRLSIFDVASACGYDDATTFTRAFRREFHMNPSEWRRSREAPESVA